MRVGRLVANLRFDINRLDLASEPFLLKHSIEVYNFVSHLLNSLRQELDLISGYQLWLLV